MPRARDSVPKRGRGGEEREKKMTMMKMERVEGRGAFLRGGRVLNTVVLAVGCRHRCVEWVFFLDSRRPCFALDAFMVV